MIPNLQKTLAKTFRFEIFILAFTVLFLLSSCVVTQERGPYHQEPGPVQEVRPVDSRRIEGLWLINAGNATGKLELFWIRNRLAGRIWFDTYNRWEDLTEIFFDQRTGRLEFSRPEGSERYVGTFSGNSLSGTYTSRGGPAYNWDGRRGTIERTKDFGRIEGHWSINAGNATGKLELFWIRNRLAGRIWFDAYNRWEDLTEIFFDQRTGRLEFFRPEGSERYVGTFSGNSLSGTYTSRGGPAYNWDGRRP